MFDKLRADFIQTFIDGDRWRVLITSLGVTLKLTFFALLLGVALGVLVAVIRSSHDQMAEQHRKSPLMSFANALCKLYLTVIRGTPAMVQLLIMYFVIFASSTNTTLVATLTFGINSGAYVAEIFRGGIMAIDKGQMEAGRSLGLGYVQTMKDIIIPQAFKSVLPSLVNELISLLKETSICGYIGLNELTRGGDIIRGTTFDALLPLLGVALIYLALVLVISYFIGILERRLRASDHR